MKQRGWLLLAAGISLLSGCAVTTAQQVSQLNEEGISQLQAEDYVAAKQRFEAALALEPDNAVTLYNLANAAHLSGDVASAERYYRASLERDLTNPACRHGLALLLLQTGRGAEAWQMIEAWRTAQPDSADALAEYGWMLRQKGDLPAAQLHLQHALEIDPKNVRALIELGILYETYAYPDRARELYIRALRQDPQQPEALDRLRRLTGIARRTTKQRGGVEP